MKVLITGNLGYIGTVLTETLKKKNFYVIGYDIGYFKECLIGDIKIEPDEQIIGDIRKFDPKILKKVDHVIHLAALSNDPLGEFDKRLTKQINQDASINLANYSKKAGIKKFIYLSTQSLYGISKLKKDLDEYNSFKNPITAYAKTKYEAEKKILKMNGNNFLTVALRPATVFGYSPRFRADIVYNNLILSGLKNKKIEIKSDGTPIRPILHINDLCNVIYQSLKYHKKNKIYGKCFNVGYPGGNYTVKELAVAASKVLNDCKIIYSKNPNKDERTYSISFKRLKKNFKNINLKVDLIYQGKKMINIFKKTKSIKKLSNKKITIRLVKLKNLQKQGKIDKDLKLINE